MIRTFIAYSDSLDYLYGLLLSGGLLFSLLFSKFKIVELGKDME